MKQFPDGFLWGAATASHQVEGNTKNDWSEWEKVNAKRLARKSEQAFSWNPHWSKFRDDATDPKNYLSGDACDHYHRYREDFDILKELNLNAYRFSIEWSRIEPEEGVFDDRELNHYRDMVKELRKRGIEPFVTLWHWTLPLWISKRGGWENKRTAEYFVRYATQVVQALGKEVKFWMPLNEPGTYVGMSYIQGAFPPQKRLALWTANRVFKNLMRAYRETYQIIHQHLPEAQVGISHYAIYILPYRNTWFSRLLVKFLDYIRNWRFLDSVNDTNDFIGIQFYHTDHIKITPLWNGRWGLIDVENPNTWTTDLGWDIYPEGLYHLLKRAAEYKKPIYITENGIADASLQDKNREKFIYEHLLRVHRAIEEGVDVRGYFYWSLLDNFEWDKGYWPRFGLVAIDRTTQKRTVRDSAHMYSEIARNNRLEF